MKCDFCKKRLVHPKIVHAASGAFHADCLDKLHATAETFGEFMATIITWNQKGQPEGEEPKIADALRKMAHPMSGYLKQLAQNIREQEKAKELKK